MTQLVVGKDLPNLKICVDNATPAETEHCIEMDVEERNDDTESEENSASTGKNLSEVKVNLNWKSVGVPERQPKRYENKYAFFVAELKMTAEELQKKLEERATRFGQQIKPRRHFGKDEIDAVYKSINLDVENLTSSSEEKGVRLEALHIHGVDEMSTNDIFDYFKDTTPAWIEWVNDISCNVVWLEQLGAVGALLKLSRPISLQEKSEISTGEKSDSEDISDTISVVFSAEEFTKEDLPSNCVPIAEIDDEMEDEKEKENKESSKEKASIAYPPGHWRLGMSHPKAKYLLLRFATKDDKKIPGAEKHSEYYKKYGNPNYGGMKGLISRTRKRKFMFFKEQEELKALLNRQKNHSDVPATDDDSKINKSDDDDDNNEEDRKDARDDAGKRPRMRMHADDEESNQRKKNGVHDRLGKRSKNLFVNSSSDSEPEDLEDSDISEARNYRQTSVWDRLEGFPSQHRRSGERHDLRQQLQDSSQNTVKWKHPAGGDLRSKLQRLRQDKDEPEAKHRSPMLIKPYQESK